MDYSILDINTIGMADFSWLIKIPFVVIIIGLIFYNMMMLLRIRILADTVDSSENPSIKKIAYVYTIFSVILSLISLVLILLG